MVNSKLAIVWWVWSTLNSNLHNQIIERYILVMECVIKNCCTHHSYSLFRSLVAHCVTMCNNHVSQRDAHACACHANALKRQHYATWAMEQSSTSMPAEGSMATPLFSTPCSVFYSARKSDMKIFSFRTWKQNSFRTWM